MDPSNFVADPSGSGALTVPATPEEQSVTASSTAPSTLDPPAPRRSTRPRAAPTRLIDEVMEARLHPTLAAFHGLEHPDEPRTVKEALSRPDAEDWRHAMERELQSLEDNKTWTLTELPPGRQPIKSKWVFKLKTAPNATSLYRARLVACGYSQVEGEDFTETHAPTLSPQGLRVALSIIASEDLEAVHLDFDQAYLHAPLSEDLFLRQPPGFDDGSGRVYRLHKSLYGLKQAGHEWHALLSSALRNLGFRNCEGEPGIWIRSYVSSPKFCLIALYVDDMIVAAATMQDIETLFSQLKRNFKLKTVDHLTFFLGFHIDRDRKTKTVRVSQRQYVSTVLQHFCMAQANAVASPLVAGTKVQKSADPDPDLHPYREAIGSLNYAATGTRPDISYAVGALGRAGGAFDTSHWELIKRVLRYLRGTVNTGLVLGGHPLDLVCYSDSDWGGDLNTRKSTTGYVIMLGNGCVAWRSALQRSVAGSTMEAEYIAMSDAIRTLTTVRYILRDLYGTEPKPTPVFCDNASATAMAKSPFVASRHVAVRQAIVQESVEKDQVKIERVNSMDNYADLLTKALEPNRHQLLAQGLLDFAA